MNRVIKDSIKRTDKMTSCEDICEDNFSDEHTAFLGRHAWHQDQEPELYLVTWGEVIRAREPDKTWTGMPMFYIDEWVDVEMKVIRK